MKKRTKSEYCFHSCKSYTKCGWLKNPIINLYLLFDGKNEIYFDERKVIPPLCLEKGHHKGLTVNDGCAQLSSSFLAFSESHWTEG